MIGVRSLRRRLSRRLAVLNVAVLTCASVVVYAAMNMSFDDRQQALLLLKQWQLTALLDESELALHAGTLRHRIDDFLAGHQDMSLRVTVPDGSLLYERPVLTSSGQVREVRFSRSAAPLADRVDIVLGLDIGEDRRLIRRIGLALLIAAVGAGALAALMGNLLVRRGLAPVSELVQQIRSLTAHTLDRKIDGSRQAEELVPLVDQFNGLMERLSRAYEQLECFNADVAHELGTPLSTLIGNTELALRKARSEDELRLTLASNLEDLQRMAGIIRDMLFLSQADRGSQARRTAVASLAGLARKLTEYHEAAFDEAGLALTVEGDATGAFDVPLLERALSNLLSNACRHARGGTTVKVEIGGSGTDVRIMVSNEGETIPADQQHAVFNRFFRIDPARSTADRHHGLGLAIVAAIARMHAGRTLVHSVDGRTSIGMVLDGTGAPA